MDLNKIKMEEKDLVWLPKSVAARIKELEKASEQGDLVLEYVEQSKRDLKTSLESLEDDVIQYKAQMISARKKFEEAKNAELDANYAMWEKFDVEKSTLKRKVGDAVGELKPLVDELNNVKKLMGEIRSYDIENLVKLINQLNGNFYGETGNILKFLFDNYKK